MIDYLRAQGERVFREEDLPTTIMGLIGMILLMGWSLMCGHLWRLIFPLWVKVRFWWCVRNVPHDRRPKLIITWEGREQVKP